MPANKNAVIRYQILDEILSDRHHYYSMEEITDKVNSRLDRIGCCPVTRRCLEKDLEFLQGEPFNVVLYRFSYAGKRCVKYKKRGFSIFYKELTQEEACLLCEVMNTVGQFDGLPNFEWLDNLQKQLGEEKRRPIISYSSNITLKNTNMLASLYESVANEQVLKVEYKRFGDEEPVYYIVHPYFLKEYNKRWYLVCLNEEDNKIYTMALDRFVSFTPQMTRKLIPMEENVFHRFDNSIGITVYDDLAPDDVLFWASARESQYIETKSIHQSQITVGEEEAAIIRETHSVPAGGKFFRIRCQDSYELRRELCSHFEGVIVLEPRHLVEEIGKCIAQMAQNYASLNK